jgi:hypothetical protein
VFLPYLVPSTYFLFKGVPCTEDGTKDLPPNTPPPPPASHDTTDYSPYQSAAEFELAEFLYSREQMSAGNINVLMDLLAAQGEGASQPPFASAKDLHDVIDATQAGDIPWEAFRIKYNGITCAQNNPKWMSASYEVWFRSPLKVLENMIGNPDFATEMDYAPRQDFDRGGKRLYLDLMSGNWAWEQAVSFHSITLLF